MNIERVNSKEFAKLREWDTFLLNSVRGHYSQLSTWLSSFKPYGFDFTVFISRKSGAIVGGMGILRGGNRLFSAMVSSVGPIVDVDSAAADLIDAAIWFARRERATLLQLNFPSARNQELPDLLPAMALPAVPGARNGISFSIGLAPPQMLWLEMPTSTNWRQVLLDRCSRKTRRNIEVAERSVLTVTEARTLGELEDAFKLIERNGREQGYPTRAWKDFGFTAVEQVQRSHAVVLIAKRNGEPLGVHYGILAGRRYSYVMGATIRTKPDLKVGHLLQWRAINKAHELNLTGYDFTSSGSPGVNNFKMGFRPQLIPFVGPQYVVFSAAKYRIFNGFYPYLKRHRKTVSRLLSAIHRKW